MRVTRLPGDFSLGKTKILTARHVFVRIFARFLHRLFTQNAKNAV
jgi:hypothetical protein